MRIFGIVSLLALLGAGSALAEPAQRGTCAPVSGRGYVGGCAQLENKAVGIDVPESGFADPGLACQRAQALATEQLKSRLRAADRARQDGTSFCLDLTIRCVPCGRVQK